MFSWLGGLVALMVTDGGAPAPPPWAAASPAAAQPRARAFELKPHAESEGYICETNAFVAVVFADGSVDFRRGKPSSTGGGMPVRLMLLPMNYKPEPLPPGTPSLAGEVGKLLGKAPESAPKRDINEGPRPGAPYMFADTTSLCEDPKARCFVEQRGNVQLVTASGSMDATDEVMRMLGEDPARYEKARFLAATAPFRMKLAEATRKRQLHEALAELPNLLNRIWRTPSFTREERVKIVAALREDVDPQAPGGEAAIAMIDDFMKKRSDPRPTGP